MTPTSHRWEPPANPARFKLAKKPEPCLEYVLVHELTHLCERLHTDRFAALMDRHLPDWRRYRRELNAEPLPHEPWRG